MLVLIGLYFLMSFACCYLLYTALEFFCLYMHIRAKRLSREKKAIEEAAVASYIIRTIQPTLH